MAEETDDDVRLTERSALWLALANLLDLGRVPPLAGTVFNTVLAGLGVGVYLAFDGWIEFVGAVWAILHVLAILRWVINA